MNQIFLLLIGCVFIIQTNSFSIKSCETCKWFYPNNVRTEYGLCTLFKEKIYIADQERLISNFAKHCRDNENLCGKEGAMYEPSQSINGIKDDVKNFEKQYDEIIDKCKESSNIGHGEVNEKTELDELNKLDEEIEQFTKEGLELLFKVKKFNQKKIKFGLLDKILKKPNKFTRY